MANLFKVETQTKALRFAEPFSVFLALREHFSEQNVYFLESLSGPAKDQKSSMVGFGPLFSISITQQQVKFSGLDTLVLPLQKLAIESGLIDAQLVLSNDSESLWQLLRLIQNQFKTDYQQKIDSFQFGFFGFFGYDTTWFVEELPRTIANREDMPDIGLTIYQGAVSFDLEQESATLALNHCDAWKTIKTSDIEAVLSLANLANIAIPNPNNVVLPKSITDSTNKTSYLKDVDQTLHHIQIGDIYQVQIGHELKIVSDADPIVVYQRLRNRNPSPYMYFAPFGDFNIIGASPELFIRFENNQLISRPIAGTIARGNNIQEDAIAKSLLSTDPKEIAEHVMLVDLCRNDLGRICKKDSLTVDELMVVEQYSHLFHLVSNVYGEPQPNMDAYEMIKATFPEGTVSGAPKIRAMEIIEAIETSRRGIYAGALGQIDFGGYVNLGLCIRTMVHHQDYYTIRASAGIVADSIPEKEWVETLTKLSATYWAITSEELNREHTGD